MAKPLPFAQIPLFDGIEDNKINGLLNCLHHYSKKYEKGSSIILDQENVDYVGIVMSGNVHMMKEDIWGNQTLVSYLVAGEVFGETFALRKEKNSYVSFIAASDCEVLFLALQNLLHPCPRNCMFHVQLSQNMYDLMGKRTIKLMERIEVASKGSLRDKILAYLSLQSQTQDSKYITIPLNRSEMAQYLQSNRSAMTRELSSMRDEGIIDFDGNTFQIKI